MEAPVDSLVTILLVGDGVPDISSLRDPLRMLGCPVSFVTSCEAALRTLAQRKFDLVLAADISSAAFGRITTTVNSSVTGSGTPRQFQFMFRVAF